MDKHLFVFNINNRIYYIYMSKISIFNTLIVIEQTYIEEIYKLINYWIFG